MAEEIVYQKEESLDPAEFRDLLVDSTLGERRPVDEPERMRGMVEHANLIITARRGDLIVGVARSLTDFVYSTYLSDLAVRRSMQRQGIGRELLRQTKLLTPKAKLILLAAPAAVEYYPRVGMTRHPSCFVLDDVEDLR
ncbi:MAG: GNAT family N-acetyltransferase [Ignavibacteria bacterium]|nr:GNAT family N-acetyltransferase [Ignavibacteria bacterium]